MNLENIPWRKVGFGLALVLLAYLLILPQLADTTDSKLLTMTFMLTAIGLCINWNLTGGFTGYVDFGHAVWFGTGAYVTAILMSPQSDWMPGQWPLVPSLLIGAAVAALLANLIGRLTLRLSGAYFSIAMLGFFVFMREVIRVFRPLTNGGTGLTIPPPEVPEKAKWYYIELILVVVLLVLSWWLRRTRFGTSLVAIREDEIGAEMRGINTTRNKVWIFTVSAFSTGLFGAMYAYQNTALEPDTAYVEVRTIDAVMGTMLGGLGTVIGPVLGMVALFWFREVVWENFLDYHLIMQGLILGFIVLYLPKGLIGLFEDAPRNRNVAFGIAAGAAFIARSLELSVWLQVVLAVAALVTLIGLRFERLEFLPAEERSAALPKHLTATLWLAVGAAAVWVLGLSDVMKVVLTLAAPLSLLLAIVRLVPHGTDEDDRTSTFDGMETALDESGELREQARATVELFDSPGDELGVQK